MEGALMKQQMFTLAGYPAGSIEIPDEVERAAQLVYACMQENGAVELHGLRIRWQVQPEHNLISNEENQDTV